MILAIQSAMKRMLIANDSWERRVMREVILDEMNKLNRLFNQELDRYATSETPEASGRPDA